MSYHWSAMWDLLAKCFQAFCTQITTEPALSTEASKTQLFN